MQNHILNASIVIILFILISISFVGWGKIILRIAKTQAALNTPFLNIWIGFISSIFLAELWQLFLPVNWMFTLSLTLTGLVFFSLNYKLNFKIQHKFNFDKFILIFLPFSFLVFIFISKVMIPSGHYDVALYYEPTIDWLNHYSISFGLGNLHSRLAYNQSFFLFPAYLNPLPFWNHGLNVANVYILILTVLTLFKLCCSIPKVGIFTLFVISIVFIENLYSPISPSPDTTIGILQILIFVYILYIYHLFSENKKISEESLILLLFLFTLSVSIKLSSIFFVFFCALFIHSYLIQFFKNNKITFIIISSICFFFFSIHLFRGYVLSGFPMFPSTIGGLKHALWAVPLESVENEALQVYAWARWPGKDPSQVLQNWGWLPIWLKAFPLKGTVLFGLSLLFVCLSIFSTPRKDTGLPKWPNIAWLFLPLSFSFILWFLTAPDYRFLGSIPELFLTLSILIFAFRLKQTKLLFTYNKKLKYLIVIFISLVLVDFFSNLRFLQNLISISGIEFFYPNNNSQEIVWKTEAMYWRLINAAVILLVFILFFFFKKPLFNNPVIHRLTFTLLLIAFLNMMTLITGFFINEQKGWRSKPAIASKQITTKSGLQVNTPVKGDQCGNVSFPCTPYVNSNLRSIENYFNTQTSDFGFKNLSVK
jgi:hypothetical protein